MNGLHRLMSGFLRLYASVLSYMLNHKNPNDRGRVLCHIIVIDNHLFKTFMYKERNFVIQWFQRK